MASAKLATDRLLECVFVCMCVGDFHQQIPRDCGGALTRGGGLQRKNAVALSVKHVKISMKPMSDP